LLNLLKNNTFILTPEQLKESVSGSYLGINRATLGPKDIYNPYNKHNKGTRPFNLGIYVYPIPRKINSSL